LDRSERDTTKSICSGFQKGSERFNESDTIEPGSSPVLCDIGQWRFGMSICYDLRFPELYRRLAPADALLVPSAFTYTTGQAHSGDFAAGTRH
jgi:nitrilase